jgi:hypothetical protein
MPGDHKFYFCKSNNYKVVENFQALNHRNVGEKILFDICCKSKRNREKKIDIIKKLINNSEKEVHFLFLGFKIDKYGLGYQHKSSYNDYNPIPLVKFHVRDDSQYLDNRKSKFWFQYDTSSLRYIKPIEAIKGFCKNEDPNYRTSSPSLIQVTNSFRNPWLTFKIITTRIYSKTSEKSVKVPKSKKSYHFPLFSNLKIGFNKLIEVHTILLEIYNLPSLKEIISLEKSNLDLKQRFPIVGDPGYDLYSKKVRELNRKSYINIIHQKLSRDSRKKATKYICTDK